MEFGSFEPRFGVGLFLVFLAAMVCVEAAWLVWVRKRNYDWRAAFASFGVAIGKRLIDAATAGIAGVLLLWLYQYRLFTLKLDDVFTGIAFFVLFELAYYWHHRLAHEVRWLWAFRAGLLLASPSGARSPLAVGDAFGPSPPKK